MKESEIVRKCQDGNQQAQQALYACYADRLYRLGYRYVKQQTETEDIIITAFLKIFKNIKSFTYQHEGSFEAWMRKIVINEALMWLRKKHNFNLTETLDADNPDHDLEIFQDVDSEYLYQLILELPSGYRTVFNLFVIEGYDHREISQLLKITESTSRSQLYKAKVLLRRRIKQEDADYGT